MPYAKLTLGLGVSVPSHAAIAESLTRLIALELEKRHELTSLSIESAGTKVWTIGGRVSDQAAHLDVYVTAGTNSLEQKRRFISEAMKLLRAVMPGLPEATYVIIHELPGENWGYDGQTQQDRATRRSAVAP